ncbi:uncharacterized protein LOC130712357 [Lotus japonicus]|uniref:uncharacterized protein LOC130712357 n=1 Tax=Lotus japonicus TaxID=34305 RepID=UPI00258E2440|nr:uncharacterized protein LOC130712357 [Lotus japonicus]
MDSPRLTPGSSSKESRARRRLIRSSRKDLSPDKNIATGGSIIPSVSSSISTRRPLSNITNVSPSSSHNARVGNSRNKSRTLVPNQYEKALHEPCSQKKRKTNQAGGVGGSVLCNENNPVNLISFDNSPSLTYKEIMDRQFSNANSKRKSIDQATLASVSHFSLEHSKTQMNEIFPKSFDSNSSNPPLSTVIATSSKHPSPSILKPNKPEREKQTRAPSRMKKVKIIKELPTPIRSESKWSRYLRKKALDTKRGRFSPSNGTADEAGPSNVALCEPGALSSDSEDAESDEDYVEHTHEVIPEIPANIVALLQIAENTDVLDFGDPTSACFYCGAFMWASEKSGKIDSDGAAAFSLCCMKGKVDLPLIPKPPPLLLDLITDREPRAQNFKENIRAYNSMFSFTSMGGKVLTALNDGGGPPQFVLSGQNYHRMGSLIPRQGQPPKFAQLYIYDTQNENSNRVRNLRYEILKLILLIILIFYYIIVNSLMFLNSISFVAIMGEDRVLTFL